jgi:hypothetical protein
MNANLSGHAKPESIQDTLVVGGEDRGYFILPPVGIRMVGTKTLIVSSPTKFQFAGGVDTGYFSR